MYKVQKIKLRACPYRKNPVNSLPLELQGFGSSAKISKYCCLHGMFLEKGTGSESIFVWLFPDGRWAW